MGRKKSRANGDADVYARKNSAGEITSYRGAYFGPDGKRRYVSGKTKTEARQKLSKARQDSERGIVAGSGNMSLATYLDRWLETSVKDVVRQSTYERYETLCRVHIKPAVGRVTLKSLTADHLRGLYRDKLASGLSPRTVNYIHVTIHKALGQANSDGRIGVNVARGVKSPRPVKPEIQPLTAEQARTLIQTANKIVDRYRALYVLALHSGMRSGEMLGLKWSDVDLSGASNTLQVRRTLSETRTGRRYELPKSGKGRSIKLSRKALDALKAHKSRQAQERLAAGTLWQDEDLVFPTSVGTPTSATNLLGRHFKPLLREAGLPDKRLHDLRHTCATILLIAGKHPKYVQELLGHASISITLDTYSHVIEGMDGGLGDAMDEAL